MTQHSLQENRIYRAVFFDLDGTLVPMELQDLLDPYYHIIGTLAARKDLNPQIFITQLNDAIFAMMKHEAGKTNAKVFWERFFENAEREGLNVDCGWNEFFSDFYEHHYPSIGDSVSANPAAAKAIGILNEKGYPLVLATMPLFPIDAVKERLRWAGVDPSSFERITSFENSSAAKPSLRYYQEILEACDLNAEDVLMVRNNTKEDLVFMELGADAFLVTDYLLDPENYDISTVRHGSLKEFAEWVKTLPACANPAGPIQTGALV